MIVFFCDIANSTALAERLGPEPMHALLNRFFALALEEIHRYESRKSLNGCVAVEARPLY